MKRFYAFSVMILAILFLSSCVGGSIVSAPESASSKLITAFSVNNVNGVITGQNIAVTMPFGTNVTALIATFTTTGTSVKVGTTVQVSALTPNNFTNPVVYTVTAADNSIANYTVTVTAPMFACVADGDERCACLIQNDGSATPLMWYATALTNNNHGYTFSQQATILATFNSGAGHCGHTDWRIPTLSTTDNNNHYFGAPQITNATDFGKLGNYAISNGYVPQSDLAIWLNANGPFVLPTASSAACIALEGCFYWSSTVFAAPLPTIYAWEVYMNVGSVGHHGRQVDLDFLLPVCGG